MSAYGTKPSLGNRGTPALRGVAGVTGLLQFEGQFGVPTRNDAAVDHDVYHVGLQFNQEAVEVGDGHNADLPRRRGELKPTGHRPQGIDVEARIDLVEDAQGGPE